VRVVSRLCELYPRHLPYNYGKKSTETPQQGSRREYQLFDMFLVRQLNPHLHVLYYLYHVPPICFGTTHTIFRENLYTRCSLLKGARGGAVGWDSALQAGRSRVRFPMVSLEFFIDIILPVAIWPWIDSASNRNKYRDYFLRVKDGRCVGLTTLPPSWVNCLAIWELQLHGTLRACPGLY